MSYEVTKSRMLQWVGILILLAVFAGAYWYFQVRAGVKSNTASSQPQGVGRLDSGLAGYWKLDETTGSTATDASTNGNNGTLVNMENGDWVAGQIGNGLDFDGTNERVDVSNASPLQITKALTISAWVKADSFTPANDNAFVSKYAAGDKGYMLFATVDNGPRQFAVIISGNGSNDIARYTSTTVTTGQWYHVVGVYDPTGPTLDIYLNGVRDSGTTYGTVPSAIFNSTSALTIGTRDTAGGKPWDGQVDEARVYSRALSADEIGQLYRLTAPTSVDTSLKGYWSFDGQDISGMTAYDRSGAGNTGTLTNGPAADGGIVGQGLSFDGTDDYVVGTVTATADIFTYSAWINPSTNSGTIIGTTSNGIQWRLSSGKLNLVAAGTSEIGSSIEAVPTNTWTHVSITNDASGNYTFYINGHDAGGSGTNAYNYDNHRPAIGSRYHDAASELFTGAIDEVRIYNRALSASEIKSLYDIAKPDATNSASSQAQGTGRLDSGLSGYWKLDETTGSSASDASTNGNTGTLTNMENGDWVTGQIGNGLDFDGTNEYVSASATPFTGHSSGTITAWIKSTNASAAQTIFGLSTLASSNYAGYFHTNANGKLQMRIKGNGVDLVNCGVSDAGPSSQVAASGTWTFVAITNDAAGKKIYKNAYQQNSDCGSDATWFDDLSAQTPVDASIGSWLVNGTVSTLFQGSIDEVRVYDHALSLDEIVNLYRVTTPTAVDTGLKGYWSFNGQDMGSAIAYDRSGVGNNGTLTGGPTVTKGIVGQALSLDGTNDVVTTSCPSSLSNATVSFWAKTNGSGGAGNKHPFDIRDNLGGSSVIAFRSGAADDIFIRNAGGTTAQITTLDYSLDNTWHQYAMTIDGTNLIGYKDGISSGSVAWSSSLTGIDNCYIGDSNGTDAFAGSVDEVRVYTRALTASEIKALYEVGTSDKINTSITQSQGTGRLDSGLAGYWKLDENTGTSAADSSTNGNNGTFVNSPTWTTGRIGSGLTNFTTTTYVSVPHSATLNSLPFSLSFWMKTTDSGSRNIVIGKDYVDGYRCQVSGGEMKCWFITAGGADWYDGSSGYSFGNVADDQWHLITMVITASGGVGYIDGVQTVSQPLTGGSPAVPTGTGALQLGTGSGGIPVNDYTGSLDEVRIYNRALSADEVSQLYRLNSPTGTDTSLKGYWSFNGQDMTGTTAYDRSGGGNNGTLTNGPTPVRGKVGQALNFVAASETLVDVPNTTSIDLVGTMTVSTWVKLGATTGANQRLLTKGTSDGYHLYWLSGGELAFGNSTGFKKTTATYSETDGWIHVTATYDNSGTFGGYLLYINGQLVTSTATAGSFAAFASGGTLGIGGRSGWPGTNGSMDEVRIYSRTLSASEVLGLYNQSR